MQSVLIPRVVPVVDAVAHNGFELRALAQQQQPIPTMTPVVVVAVATHHLPASVKVSADEVTPGVVLLAMSAPDIVCERFWASSLRLMELTTEVRKMEQEVFVWLANRHIIDTYTMDSLQFNDDGYVHVDTSWCPELPEIDPDTLLEHTPGDQARIGPGRRRMVPPIRRRSQAATDDHHRMYCTTHKKNCFSQTSTGSSCRKIADSGE